MNRIRRTGTAPVGSGNTAGFAVEDSTGYLVVDAGSDNNRAFRRKAVAPADSAVAQNVFSTRQRVTLAQINAGFNLIPAIKGFKARLIDGHLTAIGGNAAGATSVRISGTQATAAAHLVTITIAGATLNQNLLDRIGAGTGNTVLVAGASFVPNDVNTAVHINANGTLTTLTHVDVNLTYALEAA